MAKNFVWDEQQKKTCATSLEKMKAMKAERLKTARGNNTFGTMGIMFVKEGTTRSTYTAPLNPPDFMRIVPSDARTACTARLIPRLALKGLSAEADFPAVVPATRDFFRDPESVRSLSSRRAVSADASVRRTGQKTSYARLFPPPPPGFAARSASLKPDERTAPLYALTKDHIPDTLRSTQQNDYPVLDPARCHPSTKTALGTVVPTCPIGPLLSGYTDLLRALEREQAAEN